MSDEEYYYNEGCAGEAEAEAEAEAAYAEYLDHLAGTDRPLYVLEMALCLISTEYSGKGKQEVIDFLLDKKNEREAIKKPASREPVDDDLPF